MGTLQERVAQTAPEKRRNVDVVLENGFSERGGRDAIGHAGRRPGTDVALRCGARGGARTQDRGKKRLATARRDADRPGRTGSLRGPEPALFDPPRPCLPPAP